jgi:hypothetical protein
MSLQKESSQGLYGYRTQTFIKVTIFSVTSLKGLECFNDFSTIMTELRKSSIVNLYNIHEQKADKKKERPVHYYLPLWLYDEKEIQPTLDQTSRIR